MKDQKSKVKNQKLNLKSKTFNFLLAVFTFAFLLLPLKANAQSVDLGIYPPVFQIQTTPPSSINIPFSIQNFAGLSVKLVISLKPFTASSAEDGTVSLLSDLSSFPDPSLLQKVQVLEDNNPTQTLTLAPKQKKDLNLAIEIPENQTKGDYYISLVFTSNNQNATSSNYSEASAGIASNILLSIGPPGETKGYIEDFSAPPFVTKGPLPFTVKVKNVGDHYITPKGDIIISNMFGQKVGKINLLPVNILSNTTRRIPDVIQKDTTAKDYASIKTIIDKNQYPVAVWPEKFLVGPYTATLTIALSDTGPLYKKSVVFFAFPSEYLLGIIAIVMVVVFIVLRVKKKLS